MGDRKPPAGKYANATVTSTTISNAYASRDKLEELEGVVGLHGERLDVLHENIMLEHDNRQEAIDAEAEERAKSDVRLAESFATLADAFMTMSGTVEVILHILELQSKNNDLMIRNTWLLVGGEVVLLIWVILMMAGVL